MTHVTDDHVPDTLWTTSRGGLDTSNGAFEVLEEDLVDEHDRVDVAEQGGRVIRRDDSHRRVLGEPAQGIRVRLIVQEARVSFPQALGRGEVQRKDRGTNQLERMQSVDVGPLGREQLLQQRLQLLWVRI